MLRLLPLLILPLLAACSESRETRAANACVAEVGNRLAGRNVTLDAKALAATVAPAADGMLQVSGPIVFDRGLSGEYTQTLDCRVRFEADAPVVIFLQFNWSMDDVRKSAPAG